MDKLIVSSINQIRQSKKRPDTEVILKRMQKEALEVLTSMIENGLIENRPSNGEESLWVAESGEIDSSSSQSKTDEIMPGDSGTHTQPNDIIDNGEKAKWDDFESFKKFIHGEVLDLKAKVASRNTPEKSSSPDYERAFIRSLEHRIVSLEKQLDSKQKTIDKLLEDRFDRAIFPDQARLFPNCHAEELQVPATVADYKRDNSRDNFHKRLSQKSIELNKRTLNVETMGPKTTKTGSNSASVSSSKQQVQTTECDEKSKGSGSTEKKRIVIIGDSMVNNIQENGLNKHHHVQIKRHGGATTLDVKDFIKPIVRRKPDLIIIHTGTNDLTDDNVNTAESLTEIFEAARDVSPETEIVMSSAITRQDKPGMPKKVKNLNKVIDEVCEKFSIKVMSNSNIGGECLSSKKLHLNQKGNSVFARNFLKFISNY